MPPLRDIARGCTRPIPGSMRTGTAPRRRSPKVSTKSGWTWTDQQRDAVATPDAQSCQPLRACVTLLVELIESNRPDRQRYRPVALGDRLPRHARRRTRSLDQTLAAALIHPPHRMRGEKRTNQRHDAIGRVFQHIVACIGEAMHLGGREPCDPLLKKVVVKDEVSLTPANHHGPRTERLQTLRGLSHEPNDGSLGPRGISCTKRSVAMRLAQLS